VELERIFGILESVFLVKKVFKNKEIYLLLVVVE